VASEKQAIDATLSSLSAEDPRFRKVADRYWNARGGSYTDGGAFIFTTTTDGERWSVSCADKFGRVIEAPPGEYAIDRSSIPGAPRPPVDPVPAESGPAGAFERIVGAMPGWRLSNVRWIVDTLVESTSGGAAPDDAVDLLALLVDRMYDTGGMKRSAVREILEDGIDRILGALPGLDKTSPCPWRRIDRDSRGSLRPPRDGERVLVVDASRFDPEGDDCDARLEVDAHGMGWKRFVIHRLRGQRFTGCGFGPGTSDVTIDVFGSSGDYLASGIDGMRITVHGNGQDQLAQIMKDGELVVHGDVGQAFLYGGKGGEVYIRGNGAGRPLINAVGRPRVVINGTCLDYLAEAFMAGDPHAGGGFVVLNGLAFDDRGRVVEQPTPYPGSNLFSLASGGAIFVRDPHRELVDEQLNGGEFAELTDADWDLVRPYLEKNQRLFGIRIDEHLLTVDGVLRPPREVYRKVRAVRLAVLAKVQVPE